MVLSIKFGLSIVATVFIALGFYNCITDFEENKCEMTWMYENPNYVPVSLPQTIRNQFPIYKLFVYGEGSYAKQLKNGNFNGIPVLFIPGNSGSFKQVRSLGSISLRMSHRSGFSHHFNFFVADFQQEMSALYGPFLQRQSEFVAVCVKKILSLYHSHNNPPTSVILVGHSMGGLVARSVFCLSSFNSSFVHTIISIATPHQAPVIFVDKMLDKFYENVNGYWSLYGNTSLRHVTLVSVGGGYRDYQVRSGLTLLDNIVSRDRGLSTTTMSVPLSWVSTDHQCSLWCRQIVLTIVRSLFDIVSKESHLPSQDADYRMRVFQHHFLHRAGHPLPDDGAIHLDSSVDWHLHTERLFRLFEEKVDREKYVAVSVSYDEAGQKTDSITVLSNLVTPHWICACRIPPGESRCYHCLSLVGKSRLLPGLYSSRKYIHMRRGDLADYTHLVLYVARGATQVEVVVDKYRIDSRHLVYELPGIYDTIMSLPISVMDGSAMLHMQNSTVFYSLHLAGLSGPLTAYTAVVSPVSCRRNVGPVPESDEGSVLTLSVPWSNENTYQSVRYGDVGTLPVKLQCPRRGVLPDDVGYEHSEAHLDLYLHPNCHYQLRLHISLMATFGQFFRFYGVMYPVMFVAVFLTALTGQMELFAKDANFIQVPDAIIRFSKPHYIVPACAILHYIISTNKVSRRLSDWGVGGDDITQLESRQLWFPTLPAMLYITATCVGSLTSRAVHLVVAAIARVSGVAFFWLPDRLTSLSTHAGYAAAAVGAVLLSGTTCGTCGMCVALLIIVVKMQHLYYRSLKFGAASPDKFQYIFYQHLSLIFVSLIIINCPALVVWIKELRIPGQFTEDPSRLVGCLSTVCLLILVLSHGPTTRQYGSLLAVPVRWGVYLLVVTSVPYCLLRMYRLNVVISLALILVTAAHSPEMFLRSRVQLNNVPL